MIVSLIALAAIHAHPAPHPASRSQHRKALEKVAHEPNFAALAECESGGNPHASYLGRYFGLYQFDVTTWASVGGVGNPADASPAEQTERARQLYNERGSAPWPVCGWHLEDAA